MGAGKRPTRFSEFSNRFGASFRTKNTNSPIKPHAEKMRRNKRMYVHPDTSEIPAEFIRLDKWEAEYLFMVAERARKGIVETGRFNGGSVFLMAWANRAAPIYSVDIAPQNDDLLRNILTQAKVGTNVELIVGDSQHGAYPQIGPIDLLFVDGDHSFEGCKADLENWWPHVVPGGHVLLHDCYNGSPVMDAVISFVSDRDVLLMRSPFISHEHWLSPAGSMMHFVKRS